MNSKSDPKRGNMTKKFTAAALTVALILMLTLACSGDESPAAPEADQTQQELLDTIERMGEEMDSLKQEMEESKETRGADEASVQEDETALTPATTSLPDSTPELTVIPTPSGPGICGRSPAVQKAILKDLKVSLCRAVTEGELFRITALGADMNMARPRDFHALVNIEVLVINATNVEPGALTGLESLKKLHLTIKDDGSIGTGAVQGLQRLEEMTLEVGTNVSIETGAFQELDSLEKLTISPSKDYPEPEDILTLPDFDQLPSLKYLDMKDVRTLYAETLSDKLLANLPSLESLNIFLAMKENESDSDTEMDINIPEGLFASNRMLKKAAINIEHMEGITVHLPESLFSNTASLERVEIKSRSQVVPADTFRWLTKLEELTLGGVRDGSGHQINLSESSPLYNKIKYGGEQGKGYKVLNAQD